MITETNSMELSRDFMNSMKNLAINYGSTKHELDEITSQAPWKKEIHNSKLLQIQLLPEYRHQ